MPRFSLHAARDSWEYLRINPDAVELSRQQAVALVEGGVQALEDRVAEVDGHGGALMFMLPEHRRAAVRALFGDAEARAALFTV